MSKISAFRYVSYSEKELKEAIGKLTPILDLDKEIGTVRALDFAIIAWFNEYMSKDQKRTSEEHFDLGVLIHSAYSDVHSKECMFKYTED